MLSQKPESYTASKKKKIGLIIGSGDLAIYCMEKLVILGYEIIILRLPCSRIKIERDIKHINIRYEKIGEALLYLRQNSVIDIALIGYLERPVIDILNASVESRRILSKVVSTLNEGDGAIFTAVKKMLIDENFNLVKVQDLLPELTLSPGRFGSPFEGKIKTHEIEKGISVFVDYAKLDVGQSLVFQGGHCLGMETITGTDEMIKAVISFRKSDYGKALKILSGGILIKGSKPKQVLDIDTPVIGPNTIKLAHKAKLNGLVIESNKVILFNKDLIIDLLKSYNMFLFSTKFFKKNL